MTITKGERSELRSVVKQQFKVLRSEVRTRREEMEAEVEERLHARYVQADRHREKIEGRIAKLVDDSNEKLDKILDSDEVEDAEDEYSYTQRFRFPMPRVVWNNGPRDQFRRALMAEVDAVYADAIAQLDRQEADLLRTLAIGALETEEAKTFLGTIPTVAQLVPSNRLAELEAQFEPKKALDR